MTSMIDPIKFIKGYTSFLALVYSVMYSVDFFEVDNAYLSNKRNIVVATSRPIKISILINLIKVLTKNSTLKVVIAGNKLLISFSIKRLCIYLIMYRYMGIIRNPINKKLKSVPLDTLNLVIIPAFSLNSVVTSIKDIGIKLVTVDLI